MGIAATPARGMAAAHDGFPILWLVISGVAL